MFYTTTLIRSPIGLFCAAGCEQKQSTSPPSTQVAALKANCVICVDHELDVDASTASTEYNGKTYYFCSDYCKTEFGKDPEKYLAIVKARSQPTTASAPAGG